MAHFQVTFLKSLLSSDGHQFRCPQQVIDLDAINAEIALKAAKRRFEHLLHLRDWRMRADFVEVSPVQIEPEAIELCGSLRFRCPVREQELYSGIDTDAGTLSHIRTLDVTAECPFCEHSHTWHGNDGTLGRFAH
jgi:hypothetical protein